MAISTTSSRRTAGLRAFLRAHPVTSVYLTSSLPLTALTDGLLLKLLHPANFGYTHTSKLLLPTIKSRFADTHLTGNLDHRITGLELFSRDSRRDLWYRRGRHYRDISRYCFQIADPYDRGTGLAEHICDIDCRSIILLYHCTFL